MTYSTGYFGPNLQWCLSVWYHFKELGLEPFLQSLRSSANGAVAVGSSRPNGAGSASFWTTSLFACAALSRWLPEVELRHTPPEAVWELLKKCIQTWSNLYISKNGVPKRDQEMSNFVGPLVLWNLITFTQLTHFSGSRCSGLPDGRRGRWQKPPERRTPRLRRPMRQALAAISWMVVSFPRDCNLADWVCCRATISSFHQFLSVYHSDDDPHFILLFLGQVETTNRKKLGGSIAVGQNVSDISRSDDTDFGWFWPFSVFNQPELRAPFAILGPPGIRALRSALLRICHHSCWKNAWSWKVVAFIHSEQPQVGYKAKMSAIFGGWFQGLVDVVGYLSLKLRSCSPFY